MSWQLVWKDPITPFEGKEPKGIHRTIVSNTRRQMSVEMQINFAVLLSVQLLKC